MRCSSSRVKLDEYVDGTLEPLRARAIERHLAGCGACGALLEELRSIDALLLTARTIDPSPAFTFATMAEVRSLPAPHVHRSPVLSIGAVYLVFAWTLIGLWFAFGGSAGRGVLSLILGTLGAYGAAIARLSSVTGGVFGHATSGVTALMGAILALDIVATVGIALVYGVVRPRLAAHLARSWETG